MSEKSENKEMQSAVMLPVSKIELNTGQIEGLPKNPRFIRDGKFEKLKQSIQDAPEMLEMRSLIVVAKGMKYVVICGNMRLRACLDLGYKELPCYVLPEDTPVKKLREYTIKDNIGYGQNDWDIISAEWDFTELEDWGMDLDEWTENNSNAENLHLEGSGEVGSTHNTINVGKYVCYLSEDEMEEMKKWVAEYIEEYGTTIGFFSNILDICRK